MQVPVSSAAPSFWNELSGHPVFQLLCKEIKDATWNLFTSNRIAITTRLIDALDSQNKFRKFNSNYILLWAPSYIFRSNNILCRELAKLRMVEKVGNKTICYIPLKLKLKFQRELKCCITVAECCLHSYVIGRVNLVKNLILFYLWKVLYGYYIGLQEDSCELCVVWSVLKY